MTLPFDLLVFDWDGTLMDSQARIVNCMQGAMRDTGVEVLTPETIRGIIGLGMREVTVTLFPDADENFIVDFTAAYRRHFVELDETPSALFPGAAEVVQGLGERDYLLAVATGKSHRGLTKVLGETGIGSCFQATRCADQTHSKPHPQMLEELMDELGVEPARTLMIGDTSFDLQMARNARAGALAVSYGAHPVDDLLALEPLDHIDAITELPTWLGNYAVRSASR